MNRRFFLVLHEVTTLKYDTSQIVCLIHEYTSQYDIFIKFSQNMLETQSSIELQNYKHFLGNYPRLPYRDAIIETVVKVILTLKSESEPGSPGQIN